MFSHMFLLFLSLLLVFSQNCYLLITSRLSRLHGNPISCPISRTLGTPSQQVVHAPPCFWHRTHGFLEARCLGNLVVASLPVNFPFSAFCRRFLVQTSIGLNTNHTFLSLKNPRTDTFLCDLGLAKLCSTARVWNPQGISKLMIKVDYCLSYDSFLALCSWRQCGPSLLQMLCSGILNVPLPYGGRPYQNCTIVPKTFWPQAGDTARQKRKRRADSDLRRSDQQRR